MMAIFGGKNPHPQTLVVGGVTSVMDLDAHRIGEYLFRLKEMKNFVETAYIPDVLLAATYYKDEGLQGIGGGVKNYLSYGGFPLDDDWGKLLFPSGVVKNRDLAKPLKLDEAKITEEVTHSWYKGSEPLHPYEGTTEPEYTGYDEKGNVKGDEKYSWCKAPRYDGQPYEVGPLARFIVGYAQGHPEIKDLVDSTLKATGLPATVLFSTLGRTAARALETKYVGDHIEGWVNELVANIKAGDTRTWTRCDVPDKAEGRGMTEPPRGRPGPLDQDREQGDRQLPGRGSLDLELLAPGQGRTARSLRGIPHRDETGQGGSAAGDPPDDPLLRSVHGLRGPHHRSEIGHDQEVQGVLKGGIRGKDYTR